MSAKRNEPTHPFLLHFPWQLRGAIGNYFYTAAREGIDNPTSVCRWVWHHLQKQLMEAPDTEGQGVQKAVVCQTMREHKDQALDFARCVIDREARRGQ